MRGLNLKADGEKAREREVDLGRAGKRGPAQSSLCPEMELRL